MRKNIQLPMAFIVSTLMCCMAMATEPLQKWKPLTGAELVSTFEGKKLADGVHYAYRFFKGGKLQGANMGKLIEGRWAVKGNEICWQWRGDENECYSITRRGNEIRAYLYGVEVLSGRIFELNSRKEIL